MNPRASAVILAGGEGSRLKSIPRALTGDDQPKLARLRSCLGHPAGERTMSDIYGRIAPTDFSRDVLHACPERLPVVPVRDVEWNDIGEPGRLHAARRRHAHDGVPA